MAAPQDSKAASTSAAAEDNDEEPIPCDNVTVFSPKTETSCVLNFRNFLAIGKGSFGKVFSAVIVETDEKVAIKRVIQDKKYMNRELPIMKELSHPNVVTLLYYFDRDTENEESVLFLVLECLSTTVFKVTQHYAVLKRHLPVIYVKLYMYQLFRALAYIHSLQICHRDIKPNNMLVDLDTGIMKVCDFGSAKRLADGQANVSYICSRFYRAPELVFGAIHYTCAIDLWSAACVHCEMCLGEPMFPGENGVDQLVEIIRVLGTPTEEDVRAMNPHYHQCKFPMVKKKSLADVLQCEADEQLFHLLGQLLVFRPPQRCSALEACAHPYFDELRQHNTCMPNGKPLPPLFNFSASEEAAINALQEPVRKNMKSFGEKYV